MKPKPKQPQPPVAVVSQPDQVQVSRTKLWSKWLKFGGAALLLFAFGMQTKQNSQQSVRSDRIEANLIESRTHQQAISYETLYFSAKATGLNEPQYLQFAALEYYRGAVTMPTMAVGVEAAKSAENQGKIHQLHASLETVHDLDSYRKFIGVNNLIDSQNQASVMKGLRQPADASASFGNIYLILYAIGSITALVGQALGD
jgi:hypothetical protein